VREASEVSVRNVRRSFLAASHARIPADEPIAVQKARAAQPGRGRTARSRARSRGEAGKTFSIEEFAIPPARHNRIVVSKLDNSDKR
jgi:hypothetical protein